MTNNLTNTLNSKFEIIIIGKVYELWFPNLEQTYNVQRFDVFLSQTVQPTSN